VGVAHVEDAGLEITLARTEYPGRDLSIVDILPAGCGKGAAMLRLGAERGVHAAEMLAIGDNWNDLSMLEVAGHAVVMDNAPEELKALALVRGWTVGLHHDEDGVAQAIETALNLSVAGALSHAR
jgi:hydroxymethylpyrimidine pyrophosphatase-like HAD family hydrolase